MKFGKGMLYYKRFDSVDVAGYKPDGRHPLLLRDPGVHEGSRQG